MTNSLVIEELLLRQHGNWSSAKLWVNKPLILGTSFPNFKLTSALSFYLVGK